MLVMLVAGLSGTALAQGSFLYTDAIDVFTGENGVRITSPDGQGSWEVEKVEKWNAQDGVWELHENVADKGTPNVATKHVTGLPLGKYRFRVYYVGEWTTTGGVFGGTYTGSEFDTIWHDYYHL